MILVTGIISLTACGTREDSDDFMSQTVTETQSEVVTKESQADVERKGIEATTSENNDKITEVTEMKVEVNGYTFHATLENNAAVTELVQMMREQPAVIDMSDYSGFEKVGSLGTTLSGSNSQTTTKAGDIVLYNSNQIVVFYGSNSWSYTRIGHITDLTGWQEALGTGDVTITFSID